MTSVLNTRGPLALPNRARLDGTFHPDNTQRWLRPCQDSSRLHSKVSFQLPQLGDCWPPLSFNSLLHRAGLPGEYGQGTAWCSAQVSTCLVMGTAKLLSAIPTRPHPAPCCHSLRFCEASVQKPLTPLRSYSQSRAGKTRPGAC